MKAQLMSQYKELKENVCHSRNPQRRLLFDKLPTSRAGQKPLNVGHYLL